MLGREVKFQPVYLNCVLDPKSKEAPKYQARYVRQKLRPFLEHVVGNVWCCPRCGATTLQRKLLNSSFLG